MPTKTDQKCGLVEVNGAKIYYETRGTGPSVIFVSGATGDAGHFSKVAQCLADEFTVVAYDRRGNSRSPRPDGWNQTSADEQGDDTAGLIEVLDLAPAALYGTSGGAIIGLNAILRHEDLFRGAILHDPALMSVLEHPEEAMGVVQPIVEGGMAKGGPRGGLEAFLGFAAGDSLKALGPETVERMLGNAEVFFGLEFGTFESWRPAEEALAKVKIPVQVMTGEESAPFFGETSAWIAQRLGREVVTAIGAHVPNFDRPQEFADTIRPFLRKVS